MGTAAVAQSIQGSLFLFFLAVLGLSCDTRDLVSSLQNAGSSVAGGI